MSYFFEIEMNCVNPTAASLHILFFNASFPSCCVQHRVTNDVTFLWIKDGHSYVFQFQAVMMH